MEYQTIAVDKDAPICVVTINRPEKLNALNQQTITELNDVMETLAEDDSVRAIVLTGAGPKAFVAGADISEIAHLNGEAGKQFAEKGQQVFRFIEKMKKPVIAAINGFALGGGCELAMSCHLRIAATHAKLGQPEINLGIIPGYGGTQRLPRLIGLSNALYLLCTGEMISAEKAMELGLVSEVVEGEQLLERAKNLAHQLAEKAPLALHYILDAVYRGINVDLDTALDIEAECFGAVCDTEDMKEGTEAFLNKRKPVFKGR
ncbi:MAG: hypothetical protein D6748_07720 [Calditrichaeota bacterium]|nr:MAG: hypothetical protein D6748_07720 [Calditrichota bacterium]